MNYELLCVTEATYVCDYTLRLTFNNGAVRLFDFSTVFNRGVLTKLKDLTYFKDFTLDAFTVDWNNEIGFAPEFLYENGTPV